MRARTLVREAVRALKLSPGDVVMVKQGSALAEHRVLNALQKALEASGFRGVVLVVDDFDDLRSMTKEELIERLKDNHVES